LIFISEAVWLKANENYSQGINTQGIELMFSIKMKGIVIIFCFNI